MDQTDIESVKPSSLGIFNAIFELVYKDVDTVTLKFSIG